jgi:hypothetical protein
LPRKFYKPLSAKPTDDCSYWNYDLWPQPMAKVFLSPAVPELTGLTGKEKFQNAPAWSWSLFVLGSSLRTLRALREKNFFIFCSAGRRDFCPSSTIDFLPVRFLFLFPRFPPTRIDFHGLNPPDLFPLPRKMGGGLSEGGPFKRFAHRH